MPSLVRHLRLLPAVVLLVFGTAAVAMQAVSEASTMPPPGSKGLLEIRGFFDGHRATITRLGPAPSGSRETLGPPSSPIRVYTVGPDNRILHDLPLRVSGLHGAPAPRGKVQHLNFDGLVPSAEALEIDIRYQGETVAKRMRPAHAPQVVLHEPAAGTMLSVSPASAGTGAPGAIDVVWSASDADRLSLYTYIDYSGDSGGSWQNVYMGPDKGHATVRLHVDSGTASGQARLRVRVNDGFNETTAISGPLTVLLLQEAH